ncbi:MAG: transposase domain-containing protein [Saprospiraceae bacterium]|nr:transposase domain-containing protein [Saprospiraceae bacterium]
MPDIMMPPSILDIITLYSGTCKALGVNPYDYIVWYLSKVPSLKTLDIAQLAPDAFKKSLDVNT